MSKVGGSDSKNTLYCSFCGKSQHEVRKLIAGPTVFICDECVELCMDIIREENKSSLVKSRLNEMLAMHTGRSVEQVERDVDRDYFMSASEAQAYGLVDSVLEKRPADTVKTA